MSTLQNWYSTIRFFLKRIHTSFYGRIRLYTCDHNIFTVWCNYDALVSLAVVTIIFYIYLFDLYLNLLIYLYNWSYVLLLLLLSLLFLTLTLIRHIDWHELELVLCILLIWFFSTILSTRNKAFQSYPIQFTRQLLCIWFFNVSNKVPSTPTRLLNIQEFSNLLVYSNPSV